MREDRPVLSVEPGDKAAQIAETLALAFQDDPALTWLLPDAERRRRALPTFFEVMVQQSHRHGEVLASPDAKAVSLWYPPGVVRDSIMASFRDNLRLARVFGPVLLRGLKLAEAMAARHPDPQPHVYLRFVGVAPDAQGKGWGGALIRKGVEHAASQGFGTLLETATQSNVAIYMRLGFEIIEEWQVPDGGPRYRTMVHPAP
ncbi:GNAT family N-acetyltransferase [Erythrobacter sp. KY5]|uniref:GNAT family N-acetyltransferase n=1 Tax=Erythrobacter sp. KY5 TaxID=2011159 RepID=UPI0013A6D74A|nr:GNAT family N-acetyltransferase [Erythrobacter sp. KY5]